MENVFGGSSVYSLVLSQLTFALIGGNAISGERVDRSAEFLYSLPITRRKLLASKLLLALAIAAVIWLTTRLLRLVPWASGRTATPDGTASYSPCHDFLVSLGMSADNGIDVLLRRLVLFVLRRQSRFRRLWRVPHSAACDKRHRSASLVLILSGVSELHINGHTLALWYCGICLTLAPVCFAVGTWHYLRRVEP